MTLFLTKKVVRTFLTLLKSFTILLIVASIFLVSKNTFASGSNDGLENTVPFDVTACPDLSRINQNKVYPLKGAKAFLFLSREYTNSHYVYHLKRYDITTKTCSEIQPIEISSYDSQFYFSEPYLYYFDLNYVSGSGYTLTVYRFNVYSGDKDRLFDIELSSFNSFTIGADQKGRIYLSSSTGLQVFNPSGTLLAETDVNLGIHSFLGFDSSNNNIYYQGNTNWRYWGYDHDMACLKVARVNGDSTISYNEKSITIFFQNGYYQHYGNAEMLSDGLLADLTTFSGNYLFILDSGRINPEDVTDTSTSISLIDSGVSVSSVNLSDEAAILFGAKTHPSKYENYTDATGIGTRCAYDEEKDLVFVLSETNVLSVYQFSTKQLIGTISAQHPVYKLLNCGGELAAVEKDSDGWFVEQFDTAYPESIHISGKQELIIGEAASCKVTMKTQLQIPYSYESSNPSVVSITENGKMAAWKAGEAVISVKTDDGRLEDHMTVVVTGNTGTVVDDHVTGSSGKKSNNATYYTYSGSYGRIVRSYLEETAPGELMRVESDSDGSVFIEYMDYKGNVSDTLSLEAELPLFGGFYAGDDAYYVVWGQNNLQDSDEVEVVRVVKYDKGWQKLGSCSIAGVNTHAPFDAGSLRMIESQGKLYIHTCHTMYKSDDGLNHQANMTFVIAEDAMTLEDSSTSVSNLSTGYVSHSFNQFIQTDGSSIYRVDQGDANPRGIAFSATSTENLINNPNSYGTLLSFEGGYGNNYTGTCIGGYELTGTSHVVAIHQDAVYGTSSVRNVRTISLDRGSGRTKVYDVTSYSSDSTVTSGVPRLVKVDDDHLILMWMESDKSTKKKACKIVQLNSAGKPVSEIFSRNLQLSDCQPIALSDGTIAWYVTDGSRMKLFRFNPYDIPSVTESYVVVFNANGHGTAPDSQTIRTGKTAAEPEPPTEKLYVFGGWYKEKACETPYDFKEPVTDDITLYAKWTHVCAKGHTWVEDEIVTKPTCTEKGVQKYICSVCEEEKTGPIPATGHDYQFVSIENGLALARCSVCGEEINGKAPTSFKVYWAIKGYEGYYSSIVPEGLEAGDHTKYSIYSIAYSASSDVRLADFLAESDNPENCEVDAKSKVVTFKDAGDFTITVYPKFNPTLRKAYAIHVVKPLEKADLLIEPEHTQVYGNTVQLTAVPEGGKGKLTYTFMNVLEDGTEQILHEGTEPVFSWKPDAGTYQIRVRVSDAGDNDNTVSSDPIPYEVTKAPVQISEGQDIAAENDLVYGQPENELQIKGVFVSAITGEEVKGTLSPANPDTILPAGTQNVDWVFVPESDNYEKLEGSLEITVQKAVPEISELPVTEEKVYHSALSLGEITLSGGEANIPGKWEWATPETPVSVPGGSYECLFVPDDAENYETVTDQLSVNVSPAAVKILNANATGITYGDSIGEASLSGTAVQEDREEDIIPGSFSWVDPTVKPKVSDSLYTEYDMIFIPDDVINYTEASGKTVIEVAKADHPPVLPPASINLPFSRSTVENDMLQKYEDWIFESEAVGTALEVGVERSVTALYIGADAENYSNTTSQVLLIRSSCMHNGDTYTLNSKKPTCVENGATGDLYCSICNELLSPSEVIKATGHKWSEYSVLKEASCTEDGLKERVCTVCQLADDQVIPTEGHKWNSTATVDREATCTEAGSQSIHCAKCNEIKPNSESIIEAKGHHPEVISGKPATCTEDGLTEGEKCAVCDVILTPQEIISAKGHELTTVKGKEPTCTLDGLTDGEKCSVCGEFVKEQTVIPAFGHKEEILPSVAATEAKEGLTEGKKCSVCGAILVKQQLTPKIAPRGEDGTAVGKGASETLASVAITTAISDEGPAGTKFSLLQAQMKKVKKNKITIKWKRIPGAKYAVYGNACGKGKKFKKITTLYGTAYTQKGLKKGKYYKYLVMAIKDGKVVSTSKTLHIATSGGKVGNNTKVTLNKKKLAVKVGETKKLKAKAKKGKLKVKNHRKIKWESSDPTKVTVNNSGKIKAISKGNAVIYAYAQNGKYAKCTITVK